MTARALLWQQAPFPGPKFWLHEAHGSWYGTLFKAYVKMLCSYMELLGLAAIQFVSGPEQTLRRPICV